MTKYKNLFLQQSYYDAYEYYMKSLNSKNIIKWDYIIITASNDNQANSYRNQIQHRIDENTLPSSTHYAVLPDPDGKRIGSGGATLNVLKYINELSAEADNFTNMRIMVIHSGGDSKRIPQYSVCGKLFSPVPREFPDGRCSTLFDELIIAMSGIPSRMKDGMLVLSGDVLLLFNPLQIDYFQNGIAALAIKEDVKKGKNHGVFLKDENNNVKEFLHKKSIDELKRMGAVDARNKVDIDTGGIILDSNILNELFSLLSTKGKLDSAKYNMFVNDQVRLSFYADFLYPLASNSTIEKYYNETPEGNYTKSLKACRKAIWEKLSKFNMKLINLAPAEFIHFGTTKELLELVTEKIDNYIFLDWKLKVNTNSRVGKYAAINSYIDETAVIADGCYIEDSDIRENVIIEKGSMVSNVILRNTIIPSNTVLHGLKLKNGKFVVRMYKVDDNPKIDNQWEKEIFPVCGTIEEAVHMTLSKGISGDFMSLYSSFNAADGNHIMKWQKNINNHVVVDNFINMIKKCIFVDEIKDKYYKLGINDKQYEMILDIASSSDNRMKMRIYYYTAQMMPDKKEVLENLCFKVIQNSYVDYKTDRNLYNQEYKIQKDDVKILMPLRVNWGGGWSDTPPYCNENGGTVLNAAVTVNGSMPVEVNINKLNEFKVILECADSGISKEFANLSELQDCNNPYDPYALHKAALIACDVIPIDDNIELIKLLEIFGGGIHLSTCVKGIPRGSGLGTSSILAGACVKGIHDFFGISITDEKIIAKVLSIEQIMSTGGGWQDQVGGLIPGIKMITTSSGIKQNIKYNKVNLSTDTMKELNERYCLINTGQRRLARNLLRKVMGSYICSNPISINVLERIQRLAVLMRFELEKGNIDNFASLLNEHWDLSKKLDKGCTNTCIEHIFIACDDMLIGKMICGAGGGGFLQVILKHGYSKNDLSKRLKSVFGDTGVDVWECEIKY